MSEPAGPPPARAAGDGGREPDPWRAWKRFGIGLGIGALAVFVYEIVDLVRHLVAAEHPHDRGAVWSVLFMIGAIFLGVGGIAFGLARAIRRDSRRPEPPDGAGRTSR